MSVLRIPSCPILSSCGACDRMHLEAQTQLQKKKEWVEARLQLPIQAVHPSPRLLGYRARIRMRFGDDGRLGYHQPGTHSHLVVDHCAIAHERINPLLPRLQGGPPGSTIEFRTNGEQVQINAEASSREARKPLRQWLQALDMAELGLSGISMQGKRMRGSVRLEFSVCGVLHRLSPGTFFQVNLEVNQLLANRLGEWVDHMNPTHILDLFAGAGNLSLPLAARGRALTMLESGRSAVSDARECVQRMNLQTRVVAGDAGAFQAGDHFFDLAILDPPRAGAPGLIEQLQVTRPSGIAYVSCNPMALARDIAPALKSGYKVDSLELFDMFPQTSHAEVLALLRRD